MRLTAKLLLCALLIFAGYLAGAGYVWPGWPAVDNARATATAQIVDTERAVAAIATQEVQNAIDQQDWGKWNMERDGMIGNATVIAAETTRLAAIEHDLVIQAAVLTPTPAPVATQADIAGAGATMVPTVSSGKVEVVDWGGPYAGWIPIVIVNGGSSPVVITSVKLFVQDKRMAVGTYFAPTLLLPGEKSFGTLVSVLPKGTEFGASDFQITTSVPTTSDSKTTLKVGDDLRLVNDGTTLVFSLQAVEGAEWPASIVKGVCYDDAGNITGLFWLDIRSGPVSNQRSDITVNFIGAGPCINPVIGVAS